MTRETAIDILQSANLVGVLREAADMGIDALRSEMRNNCKHEIVYDEQIGEAVCKKCGYVITKQDKEYALDYSMRLLFSDIDEAIDMI